LAEPVLRTDPPTAGPPLRGRAAELAALDDALDAIGEGRSRFVFFGGEPGIGKSRLLEELSQRADARGYQVLAGRAAEFERDVPFAVWVDALDGYLGSLDAGRLRKMGVSDQEELAAIFPSLGEPARAAMEDDRHRAHRAVHELLEGLAAARPLVIELDDLHWADAASLELIATLARRPPERGVLVAGAHRPTDSLEALLATLERAGAGAVVPVDPLPDEEARALVADAVPAAQREALLHEAGGNPFYLLQLTRTPGTVGYAGPGQVMEGGFRVPAAVTASLAEELSGLSDSTRALLRGAAVVGEPFELTLAAAAAGLDADVALARIDEALVAGLVRATAVPGQFLFRHPIVRRAIYNGAGEGFRLAGHQRVADALAERGELTTRAHHLARSAHPGDEEALAVLLAAAGRHASRAPASAAVWYAAAERVARDGSPDQRADLLRRHAGALMAAGRLEESHASMEEAQRLAPNRGSVEDVLLLAEIEQWLGRPEAAIERLLALRASLRGSDPRALALTLLRLLFVVRWHGDPGAALEYGQEALEAATTSGDEIVLAAVQAQLGEMAAHVDTDIARGLLDEAAARLEDVPADRQAETIEAFYSLGWCAVHLERYEDALAYFGRCLEIARRTEGHRYAITGRAEPAEPLVRLGRVREARATASDGVEAARLHPSPRFLWWALFLNSAVELRAGDADAAASAFEECEQVAGRLERQPVVEVWTGYQRAHLLAVREEHAEAVAALEAAGGGRELPLIPINDRQVAWEIRVAAAIAAGDLEAAEAEVAEAQAWAKRSRLQGIAGFAVRCRARAALARGDPESAAAAAAASAAAFDRVGTPLDAARSRVLEGQCLAEAGRRAEAVEVLAGAEEVLHQLGAERFRAEAAKALRRLGRRTPARAGGGDPSGSPALEALSAREREIAELVHRQLTNREIAAELFLSEKTVQTHLRNIFGKLGVTSRVAVAVVVEQALTPGEKPR
jgi:DNA-binding CsgD family transcriptional regulator